MGKERLTYEYVRSVFEDRGCKLLETEYLNSAAQMRYVAQCGHERTSNFNNFQRGKGNLCSACRRKANSRAEALGPEFIKAAFEAEGVTVLNSDFYRQTDPVRYVALCGHENTSDYAHFIGQHAGRVCSKCSRSVVYQIDYVREVFENANCELIETEYKNSKTPMRYIAECGHEAVTTFDTFINCSAASHRCRKCQKHTYHENPSDRNRTASKVWRKEVYDKDGFECVRCGKHGGELNAHHLEAYDTCVEKRFEVSNGVTLCPRCHKEFHSRYGFGGNTRNQFLEWLQGNTEVSERSKKRSTP